MRVCKYIYFNLYLFIYLNSHNAFLFSYKLISDESTRYMGYKILEGVMRIAYVTRSSKQIRSAENKKLPKYNLSGQDLLFGCLIRCVFVEEDHHIFKQFETSLTSGSSEEQAIVLDILNNISKFEDGRILRCFMTESSSSTFFQSLVQIFESSEQFRGASSKILKTLLQHGGGHNSFLQIFYGVHMQSLLALLLIEDEKDSLFGLHECTMSLVTLCVSSAHGDKMSMVSGWKIAISAYLTNCFQSNEKFAIMSKLLFVLSVLFYTCLC